MSCCDDIILRMRPDVAPGAFTAELSNGALISFDRAYLEHADAETVELLQAGLMPQHMIDEHRELVRSRDGDDGRPVLTWAPPPGMPE
jgi:hypothetical protein